MADENFSLVQFSKISVGSVFPATSGSDIYADYS